MAAKKPDRMVRELPLTNERPLINIIPYPEILFSAKY
jgi:hypothetical protein